MARRGTIGRVAVLVILWGGIAGSSLASQVGLKIIVNRRNPAASIDRAFLRDVYMKRASRWSHGDAVRPIDLARPQPVRDRFAIELLEKTPAQLRSYWVQRIFSGTGTPPPEAQSPAAAIAYVAGNPGAVAYLPADVDPGAAKVIPVQ
jgi:hypothetical protein